MITLSVSIDELDFGRCRLVITGSACHGERSRLPPEVLLSGSSGNDPRHPRRRLLAHVFRWGKNLHGLGNNFRLRTLLRGKCGYARERGPCGSGQMECSYWLNAKVSRHVKEDGYELCRCRNLNSLERSFARMGRGLSSPVYGRLFPASPSWSLLWCLVLTKLALTSLFRFSATMQRRLPKLSSMAIPLSLRQLPQPRSFCSPE
jgi:hypothetical protein